MVRILLGASARCVDHRELVSTEKSTGGHGGWLLSVRVEIGMNNSFDSLLTCDLLYTPGFAFPSLLRATSTCVHRGPRTMHSFALKPVRLGDEAQAAGRLPRPPQRGSVLLHRRVPHGEHRRVNGIPDEKHSRQQPSAAAAWANRENACPSGRAFRGLLADTATRHLASARESFAVAATSPRR